MKIVAFLSTAAVVLSAHAAQAADVAHGKRVYAACAYCHGVNGKGGGVGPTLQSIVGRKSAMVDGFPYSEALKTSNIVWTEKNLKAFVASPQAVVKGTRMMFPGLKKPADVEDVVAYLKTIK